MDKHKRNENSTPPSVGLALTLLTKLLIYVYTIKYFKKWGNCLPRHTATTYDLLTYQKIIYYHACYSIHLVWERICIGTAFCPIPLFKCTFDI